MENRDISFDVHAKIEIFLDYNELDLYRRKEKSSKNGRNFCSLQIKVHKIVSYFFHRSYSNRVASTTDVVDSVITCDKLKINSYNYFLVHIIYRYNHDSRLVTLLMKFQNVSISKSVRVLF